MNCQRCPRPARANRTLCQRCTTRKAQWRSTQYPHWLYVRTSTPLHQRLKAMSQADGLSLSQVAREILETYIAELDEA